MGFLQRSQSGGSDLVNGPVIINCYISAKLDRQNCCPQMESIKITHSKNPILQLKNVSVSYTPDTYAVKDVTADIYPNTITAIMGPSGCGKSTLIRAINRLHDLYPHITTTGEIMLKGKNVLAMDPMEVRRMAGMVFQQPNPFPTMSIYDNVLAGYSLNGIRLHKTEKDEIVEQSLMSVALWDEVKDVMNKRGSFLSGGQQQRLCIARTLALKPEVLLMDEPTSALDPISTNKIEELLLELKKNFTIIIVTHNMSQAARISDNSMFMYLGELVEHGNTTQMFTKPQQKRTEEYLTGVFG
jgi:phosphate transport system ATP-binding protein